MGNVKPVALSPQAAAIVTKTIPAAMPSTPVIETAGMRHIVSNVGYTAFSSFYVINSIIMGLIRDHGKGQDRTRWGGEIMGQDAKRGIHWQ